MKRLMAGLAVAATAIGILWFVLAPAFVMSAGCCPGPSCGQGPVTGSGTPEGGCGSANQVCCTGKCNAATLTCTNPDSEQLSRCEVCGGEGQACCDGMSCPNPSAPYCTDVYSGGKYTCQSMAPPGGAKSPPPSK